MHIFKQKNQLKYYSSNSATSRREFDANNADTEIEFDADETENEMDEADLADNKRFEQLMQKKMDIPTSDNGLYLARTVAPVLTKALAEVLLVCFFHNNFVSY